VSRRKPATAGEHEVENAERWLLTYADMITLLLALFIVLFAVSTINSKKFLALALGFREAFNPNPGVLPSSNGVLSNASLVPSAGAAEAPSNGLVKPVPTSPTSSTSAPTTSNPTSSTAPTSAPTTTPTSTSAAAAAQQLAGIQAQLNQALAAKGLDATVTTTVTTQGLVVQILGDHVFYATDVANLNSTGNEVVDTVASVIRSDPNPVEVEGFTDDAPIYGGPYTTNMQLSAERAVNVAVRMMDVDGIPQSRLAVVGNGPNDPVEPNTTPANMAANRRVDIVILASGQKLP
jgi:chemotaxis protein MotB